MQKNIYNSLRRYVHLQMGNHTRTWKISIWKDFDHNILWETQASRTCEETVSFDSVLSRFSVAPLKNSLKTKGHFHRMCAWAFFTVIVNEDYLMQNLVVFSSLSSWYQFGINAERIFHRSNREHNQTESKLTGSSHELSHRRYLLNVTNEFIGCAIWMCRVVCRAAPTTESMYFRFFLYFFIILGFRL